MPFFSAEVQPRKTDTLPLSVEHPSIEAKDGERGGRDDRETELVKMPELIDWDSLPMEVLVSGAVCVLVLPENVRFRAGDR